MSEIKITDGDLSNLANKVVIITGKSVSLLVRSSSLKNVASFEE